MRLPAAASIDEGSALLGMLDVALAETGTGPLLVDASALKSFDTSTLALLLEAKRRAAALGRGLEIGGVPRKLLELARLYGVDGLLPLGE